MNLYLDASALVKRYVDEPGRPEVQAAVNEADWMLCCRLGFVETLRAVGAKGSPEMARAARRDWTAFQIIEVDQQLCERAVELTGKHHLGALDALHLAAGLSVFHDQLTFATWDRRLHAAATAEGLQTLPASLS